MEPYALVKAGGKQHRMKIGKKYKLEKMDMPAGDVVTLSDVLMVSNSGKVSIGAPFVAGASVQVTILSHGRHEKITIFKMRRRKNSRRTMGHRQYFTEVQVSSIEG